MPPIEQARCVGSDSRICVRRLHLLAGHHVKVPDRCLRHENASRSRQGSKLEPTSAPDP